SRTDYIFGKSDLQDFKDKVDVLSGAANLMYGSKTKLDTWQVKMLAGESWAGDYLKSVYSDPGQYIGAGTILAGAGVGKPNITEAYKRPSNATTAAQRASVQGKPCVSCGETSPKMVADHKTPLVKEYYQTGTINKERMKSTTAVQPHCPTCSAKQGAQLRKYSAKQKKANGL
ncbi:MAG TPA: hypothetical protein VFV31_03060, partial [Chitinophagaceae bacterium]|nr:hypothetical protein [Chitinophagaceae bacterium]